MKFLCTFSRIVIGLLFIFSGFTKAIDPVGFGYILTEYLNALGLSFFAPLALTGGIALTAFEFLLGVSLLVGLQVRLTAFLSMLFMLFFTIFTFWTALTNPVQHCGCFGDAVRLSNWATFYKNLIFTPFTLLLVWQRKRFAPVSFKIGEWSAIALFGVASILLSVHCYRHLPLIDFTGFKVGNHIPAAMTLAPDAPRPQFETTLIYQKGSETKSFSMDNLPDSTWTFLDHKTKMIKRGAIPEIPNFDVRAANGEYCTDSLLSIKGPLLVLVLPNAEKSRTKGVDKAAALYKQLAELPFLAISGSNSNQTLPVLQSFGIDAPVYFSDPKTLYTMIRSNPGLMLLYDAHVVAKWSAWDIPSAASLQNMVAQDWEVVSAKWKISERLSIEFMVVILIFLLFILYRVFRYTNKHKRA